MRRVPANRYFAYCLVAVIGVAVDLASKELVFAKLGYPERASGPIFEGPVSFRLYTSFNPGALWGMGQGHSALFAALSILAFCGVLYWLFVRQAAKSLWLTVTLALITAGTLGNLWDRLGLHGCTKINGDTIFAVRDFLWFRFGNYNWPIFNFADVFLVTGAIMLALYSFRSDSKECISTNEAPAESESAVHVRSA